MFTMGLNKLTGVKIEDSIGLSKIIYYESDEQLFDEIKQCVEINFFNELSQ